jgi:plastocyanin
VTVTNDDSIKHTWTADTGQTDSWDSGDLVAGAVFARSFASPGTFSYHCAIHAFMTGTVVVG